MRISLCFFLLVTLSYTEEYQAIISHYCNCERCCSWSYNKAGKPVFNLRPNVVKKIGQTASGAITREGLTLAMPKSFEFGTHVYIGKKLLGVCEDRGGAIIVKGDKIKIDVYVDNHKRALQLGIYETKVTVTYPFEEK